MHIKYCNNNLNGQFKNSALTASTFTTYFAPYAVSAFSAIELEQRTEKTLYSTITMFTEESGTSQAVAVPEVLQNPKLKEIDVIFINEKPLKIKYYFEDDPTEERIMIDLESFRPICGDCGPTSAGSFESLDNLAAFVTEKVGFDQCSDYKYADCFCHMIQIYSDVKVLKLPFLPPSGCTFEHFHHACWSCVNSWLLDYLRMLILHRESKTLFALAHKEICCRVFETQDIEKHYSYQYCPQFYLGLAQRWALEGYLCENVIDAWP